MKVKKIAVIGAGNMGGSIVTGIIKSGYLPASSIYIADPKKAVVEELCKKGANACSNKEAAETADLIIFAVKPYHIESVIADLKSALTPEKILVSIVAGVTLEHLENMAGDHLRMFRLMPNTAIAIQESMTCISSNKRGEQYLDTIKELFDNLGQTVVINEELMAAATVLASCGTAFALRYVRAAMQGGIEMGFGAEMAQFITAQTVKGAVQLILNTGNHPEREIDKVTTPRGITITGINEMEHKGFSSSVIQGLIASFNKMEQA